MGLLDGYCWTLLRADRLSYRIGMDNRAEVREFLTTRRARLSPQDAGLPGFSSRRRVKGLRREEVALLADVSVDYYIRLERGNLSGTSDSVLEAVARALQLSDAEHSHLFDLARTANTSRPSRRTPAAQLVRPNVLRLLDSITAPAWVRNGRADFLAGNQLGRALYSPLFTDPRRPGNTARFTFLDPHAVEFFPDWDQMASGIVATLRAEAGRHPYDKKLTDLIGELSTRSEEFRTLWAAHDVMTHRTGAKRVHHPAVGLLEVTFEAMELVADPGLILIVYGTEPGSKSEEALQLLASWAATEKTEPGVPSNAAGVAV